MALFLSPTKKENLVFGWGKNTKKKKKKTKKTSTPHTVIKIGNFRSTQIDC